MLDIGDYRENVALMLDISILGPLPCTLFFLFAMPAAEMSMLFQNTLYMKDVGYFRSWPRFCGSASARFW